MSKHLFVYRRTCLKGAGAALALPLLDVMGCDPFAVMQGIDRWNPLIRPWR
jgi:hypothetical protein